MKAPVLMYHEISDRLITDIPIEERPYAITNATFDQQLEHLSQQNISCELMDFEHKANSKAVVITFDDGHASDTLAALPKLLSHDFKAEFYITTGWIGQPGYVSISDIRKLAAAGMAVGTHGVTHKYFDDMTEPELRHELLESKSTLEDIIGQSVSGGSAPGGRIHPQTKQIATAVGYRYMCVSTPDLADLSPGNEFQFVPRFAVNRNMPLQTYSKIASGNKRTIFFLGTRTKILAFAKRALGNRNYEKVRRKLLSNKTVD